jgi:hypothetical protein
MTMSKTRKLNRNNSRNKSLSKLGLSNIQDTTTVFPIPKRKNSNQSNTSIEINPISMKIKNES